MNMEYQILIVDDQPRHLNLDTIERRLEANGFILHKRIVSSRGDIEKAMDDEILAASADLILMDWNLGKGMDAKGVLVAERLRRFVSTDIIFYTSASFGDLRKAVFEKQLEGVYCAERTTIVSKAWAVIMTTIKRMTTLNAVRGLLMAKVSECDQLMNKAILSCFQKGSSEEKAEIVKAIKRRIIDQAESTIKQVEKIPDDSDIFDLLALRSFGTFIRWRTLVSLVQGSAEHLGLWTQLEKLKTFDSEVNGPRNEMAHVVSEETEEGLVLRERKSGNIYDEKRFRQLRKEILSQELNLIQIAEELSN